jgi:copper ion binding protein
MQTTYTVSGMTCDHCVNAVRTEVGRLDGVTEVSVDLTTGAVVVTSEGPLDEQTVGAAIDEAGYALVGPAADRTG